MRIGQIAPWASPGGQPPAPPQPPPRKREGGRAKSSPEATQAVLAKLDAGESIASAARAGDVSWPTARAIWIRERHTWPPPGLGQGSSRGRGAPPRKLTSEQAAEAARRIQAGATVWATAKDLGVSRATLYRALERLKEQQP